MRPRSKGSALSGWQEGPQRHRRALGLTVTRSSLPRERFPSSRGTCVRVAGACAQARAQARTDSPELRADSPWAFPAAVLPAFRHSLPGLPDPRLSGA